MTITLWAFFITSELEWMLSEVKAVKTTLEENPRKPIHDVMTSSVRPKHDDSDDD